jgi:hypothetical protein
VVIDNCVPYYITIDRNYVLGIIYKDTDNLIPMDESVISSRLSDKNKKLLNVLKNKLNKDEIKQKPILMCPMNFKKCVSDILHKHQGAIKAIKFDHSLAQNLNH